MEYLDNIFFIVVMVVGIGLFIRNLYKVYQTIQLARPINRLDRSRERWRTMIYIALGQSKMGARPVAGFLHMIVYIGFIIINIEMLEIFIDGVFGTHRVLYLVFGSELYSWFTAVLDVMALFVIIAVVIFLFRRNFLKIKRLSTESRDLKGWPVSDANIILVTEIVLMLAFFIMNASDFLLEEYFPERGNMGTFPVSSRLVAPVLRVFDFGENFLNGLSKMAWWIHLIGVLLFMNYLYYSKHLHILLAFPNTWFANLKPKGQFTNLSSVTKEIKLMMDPNADPYASSQSDTAQEIEKFGAEDIFDLNQTQILGAYTCTECGRCTSECPANITGKKLSPRRIMMATRDRAEEVRRIIDKKGKYEPTEGDKKLLNGHISKEEIWACTTCNACVQACPILIDPLSIIIDLRRFLVMEQSAAPHELNSMMGNIENNAAPWAYNQADRLNWVNEN